MTEIVIPLFPNFTALDGIGPYEVLQRVPDFHITFIGHERGVVRSDNSMLGIEIAGTFTTSVCTGSLVLAASGLLDGLTATTYWSTLGTLAEYGAIPTSDRVVE